MTQNEKCPIVQAYALALRQFLESSGLAAMYEDDLEHVTAMSVVDEAHEDGFETLWRGFMCIEWMCEALNTMSWEGEGYSDLKLTSKSWEGLTKLKQELEARSKNLSLDYAEMRLAGVANHEFDEFSGTVTKAQAVKVLRMSSKQVAVAATLAASTILRPHLSNPRSSVSSIGKSLFQVSTAAGVAMETMMDRLATLAKVRL